MWRPAHYCPGQSSPACRNVQLQVCCCGAAQHTQQNTTSDTKPRLTVQTVPGRLTHAMLALAAVAPPTTAAAGRIDQTPASALLPLPANTSSFKSAAVGPLKTLDTAPINTQPLSSVMKSASVTQCRPFAGSSSTATHHRCCRLHIAHICQIATAPACRHVQLQVCGCWAAGDDTAGV